MPVVSSSMHLFAKPLLYTQFGMVSRAIPLGTSVQKIEIVRSIERASLPRDVRFEYNQQGSFCSSSLTTCLFSRRRSSIGVSCVYLNQTTSRFQRTYTPKTFFAVDQATNDFTFARNMCRSVQRKIRTACRKRPVTTPTDHASSTDQTTGLPEDRPVSPGASGQDGSDLETGPLRRPAGDYSSLAS